MRTLRVALPVLFLLGACAGAPPPPSAASRSDQVDRDAYLAAYGEAFVAQRAGGGPFGPYLERTLARRDLTVRGLFTATAMDPALAATIERRYAAPLREARVRRELDVPSALAAVR